MKTKPDELIKFHTSLMRNAPKEYIPHYFAVTPGDKCPDLKYMYNKTGYWSWKDQKNKLTYSQALERLKQGGNIGIAAMSYDPLIILDFDDYEYTLNIPNSLIVCSRKRFARHCYCFAKPGFEKINIPTKHGEVRSCNQYVVAPGSYCNTVKEDILKEKLPKDVELQVINDPMLGVYSVFNNKAPIPISYDELPDFYKEANEKVKEKEKVKKVCNTKKPTGKHSALFDLTIDDVVTCFRGKRYPHPLHASVTGSNFCVSNELAHCFRHNVSLNALQYLCVEAGYMSCQDAGTGHQGSGAGSSDVTGDDGAIFWAWRQAKLNGQIPSNDPIPIKAIWFIARKHNLIPKNYRNNMLPKIVFNLALQIVKREY